MWQGSRGRGEGVTDTMASQALVIVWDIRLIETLITPSA